MILDKSGKVCQNRFKGRCNYKTVAAEEGDWVATLDKLLTRIKSRPKDFTTRELDALMQKCGCICGHGGRGSSLRFFHQGTGRILTFDGPHPENTLYPYQIKKVLAFLRDIGY